jgi:hypothetical protein
MSFAGRLSSLYPLIYDTGLESVMWMRAMISLAIEIFVFLMIFLRGWERKKGVGGGFMRVHNASLIKF